MLRAMSNDAIPPCPSCRGKLFYCDRKRRIVKGEGGTRKFASNEKAAPDDADNLRELFLSIEEELAGQQLRYVDAPICDCNGSGLSESGACADPTEPRMSSVSLDQQCPQGLCQYRPSCQHGA